MAAERVVPLHKSENWKYREATLLGDTANIIEPFVRNCEGTDFLLVHREHGDPVVMLSNASWRRVLASIAVARGEKYPGIAND